MRVAPVRYAHMHLTGLGLGRTMRSGEVRPDHTLALRCTCPRNKRLLVIIIIIIVIIIIIREQALLVPVFMDRCRVRGAFSPGEGPQRW